MKPPLPSGTGEGLFARPLLDAGLPARQVVALVAQATGAVNPTGFVVDPDPGQAELGQTIGVIVMAPKTLPSEAAPNSVARFEPTEAALW